MDLEGRTFKSISLGTVLVFLWSTLLWPTISLAQTPEQQPPPQPQQQPQQQAPEQQQPPPQQQPQQQPAPQQQAGASEIVQACNQGEADARSGHSGLGYGVGGFFCGVFGLIFAFAANPQPPADKLLGKSPDYVSTYTRCYKQEAKSKNVRASLFGWGIGAVVAIAIIAASDTSTE